jgi:hypothetical protein
MFLAANVMLWVGSARCLNCRTRHEIRKLNAITYGGIGVRGSGTLREKAIGLSLAVAGKRHREFYSYSPEIGFLGAYHFNAVVIAQPQRSLGQQIKCGQ